MHFFFFFFDLLKNFEKLLILYVILVNLLIYGTPCYKFEKNLALNRVGRNCTRKAKSVLFIMYLKFFGKNV